jgi:hypothetical protein
LPRQQLEDTVIAEWITGAQHISLLTTGGQAAFRMIVSSVPLEAVARAGGAPDAPADAQDRTSIDGLRQQECVASAVLPVELRSALTRRVRPKAPSRPWAG